MASLFFRDKEDRSGGCGLEGAWFYISQVELGWFLAPYQEKELWSENHAWDPLVCPDLC